MSAKVFPAVVLLTLSLSAQNPPYSVRVDVPLVTVDVAVSDSEGRPVLNLTRDDFSIFEDGKPQVIQTFTPTESPYSILLLIDRSGSMRDYWPVMEPAIARFIARLRPQDSISIGAFDERSRDVELLLDWRQVRAGTFQEIAINPVIRGIQYVGARMSVGGTSSTTFPVKDFYRSMDWAIRRMNGVGGRKGILVFSDGRPAKAPTRIIEVGGVRTVRLKDGSEDGEFQDLLRTAGRASVPLYFVGIGTDLNPPNGRFSELSIDFGLPVRLRLEELANVSGGRVALPFQAEDVLAMYEEIGRSLGTSFTLGYSPASTPGRGTYRRIEVRVPRPDLRVQQSREGYTIRD
jgi:Ca-activated chloride channel family protein